MIAIARAGWLLMAAWFAILLSSILHVDYVGVPAELLLLALVVLAAARPHVAITVVAGVVPVAAYAFGQAWNHTVPWAETIACAALAGAALSRLRARAGEPRLPVAGSAAAAVFVAVIIAAIVAGLSVTALPLGPGFKDALLKQLTREYFIDIRGFPALHAGMLLLEGVLLFYLSARIAAERADAGLLRRMAAAAAAGATLAAALNVRRLLEVAWRSDSFWRSLIDLADRMRWNVHYSDFNAAGSYFAMAVLFAAALAVSARGFRRTAWILSALVIAIALWLTSSRTAVLAAVLAPGAVLLIGEMTRGSARALRAAAAGAAGIVLLTLVAVTLPQKGNQTSTLLATDVRLGMIQTGARMIARHPVFGIGLAQFYQRSGEFSSPELLAKFPAAVNENAHNNVVQIAAEIGVPGGVVFVCLVAAALVAIGRRAVATRDVFLTLCLSAAGAFAITCLGGHPLLIPEPGYVFWTMLGAATGSAAAPVTTRSRWRWLVPISLAAVAVTMPWRMAAAVADAELEHVGIGVSATWKTSPDDIRYREAVGHATLFIPGGPVRWMVYPVADQPVRLEVKLDGSVANVMVLEPRRWNEITLRARTESSGTRTHRLDLRVLDSDQTAIWITKVQPLK